MTQMWANVLVDGDEALASCDETVELPQARAHHDMVRMMMGFWHSRLLYAAAKLGLADLMHDGHQTPRELAAATNSHAPTMARLMRGLESMGVIRCCCNGRYKLTPMGETLRSDIPGSLRHVVIVETGGDHFGAWGDILHSIRTGTTAFPHHFGMDVWEYYNQNAEAGSNFSKAMAGVTGMFAPDILATYDFSVFETIVDVGGSEGQLLAEILKVTPRLRGILYDLPAVLPAAETRLLAEGVRDRCILMAGDFFRSVPAADLYLLKWIIHAQNDARAVEILRRCMEGMDERSRVLLVEAVVPDGGDPSLAKLMDLNMLVMTGGRERTAMEFRTLLLAAGLTATRIILLPSGLSLIEARKC